MHVYVLTDKCHGLCSNVLSVSTDACCPVITLGVQRDMFDLRDAASRGPSA